MTPLDAAFLELEDAEPEVSMAIASVAVFAGPPPGFDAVAEHLAGRVPLIRRYRQKVRRVPLDLGPPVWVDDPAFDLRRHLVHVALPAPGGDAELGDLVARVMATRLDRDRPLWRYWVVDGLAEERWALISQVHHCMVDGVSGTDLYGIVLDPGPDGPGPALPTPDHSPGVEPSSAALVARAARDLVAMPVGIARGVGTLLARPREGGRRVAALVRGGGALVAGLRPGGTSSLTGPRHRPRRYAVVRGRLDDVRAVRRRYGATVNDVVLSAVTAGFRALLLARGEEPAPDLVRTLVPVSVRAPGDGPDGNRVSLLLPRLPVHVADPGERLAATVAELTACKASHEAEAGAVLAEAARLEPYPLVARTVRWASRTDQRAVVTVATDVPGPRQTLYYDGRELLELLPYVPIGSTAQIGISIMTYRGALALGLTADESVDDLDVLREAIAAELPVLAGTGPVSAPRS
ncbi:wax ester/triacylglycerol synthase family O-acyltransferase [Actinomycetospora chlora]|uniref:Diacylglycerol O-acyltransferase n=2 Tax=Actinomycetospora chlora TaxID=663608 RepID=A0ABP9B7D4_9PSEU